MEYEEWMQTVPEILRRDPVWTMKAYRLASYLSHCVSQDSAIIEAATIGRAVLPQLARAAGSIGANIAEGYSRRGPKDRAKYFEYALNSARETRHWLFVVRVPLGDELLERRFAILDEAIRLLVTMIVRQRPAGAT